MRGERVTIRESILEHVNALENAGALMEPLSEAPSDEPLIELLASLGIEPEDRADLCYSWGLICGSAMICNLTVLEYLDGLEIEYQSAEGD